MERALEIGLAEVEVVLDELEHFVEELDRLRRQELVTLLRQLEPPTPTAESR